MALEDLLGISPLGQDRHHFLHCDEDQQLRCCFSRHDWGLPLCHPAYVSEPHPEEKQEEIIRANVPTKKPPIVTTIRAALFIVKSISL